MTKDLGTSDAPAAARSVKPPWRDARLWVGVALVAGSIVLGARVVAAADDTVRVWSARTDLEAGAVVTTDDLRPASVRLEPATAGRYLTLDRALPDGGRLARAVGGGELIPASAFGQAATDVVAVPLAVPAAAVPPSLTVGAVVDVWVAPGDRGEAAAAVLDDVIVLEVPRVDELMGPAGDRHVVVGVPEEARDGVGRVLAAGRDGRVSLTVEG